MVTRHKIQWRFYGANNSWVTEYVWAISYQDAKAKLAKSNHMIQIKG